MKEIECDERNDVSGSKIQETQDRKEIENFP